MSRTVADLAELLAAVRCLNCVCCEYSVQEQVERVLTDACVAFEREVSLSPTDRIDFLIGEIGVEIKVGGSPSSVLRQIARYATSIRVSKLVLLVTRARIASLVPPAINGKAVTVVAIGRRLL